MGRGGNSAIFDGSGGKSGTAVRSFGREGNSKSFGRGGNCKSFGESIGSEGKFKSIGSGGNSNLFGTAPLSEVTGSEGNVESKSSGSAGNSAKAAGPEIKSGDKAGSGGKPSPTSAGRGTNCSINQLKWEGKKLPGKISSGSMDCANFFGGREACKIASEGMSVSIDSNPDSEE